RASRRRRSCSTTVSSSTHCSATAKRSRASIKRSSRSPSSPRRTTIAALRCRPLAIKPDYAEAHYNLGTALRALGRYDEALKSFDRALALQPKHSGAHNNRGAVLEALGKLSDALACYE